MRVRWALCVAAVLTAVVGCVRPREVGPVMPEKALVLAEDGRSDYAIVVSESASASTRYAAEELQRFLKEMTGVALPIRGDGEARGKHEIILGVNAHLEALAAERPSDLYLQSAVAGDDLGAEGYVICTAGPHLVIAGSDVRGALYGVYGLLEDHLGCRWFTAEVSRIPSRPRLALPEIREVKVPILEYREPFVRECFDGDWCARNRMNSSAASLEERHGGKVRFGAGMFVHTFDRLMPPEQYFAEHPEYFAQVKGERLGERTQLCCTNEEVIRLCTESTLAAIRQDPGAFVYSVSQNDWDSHCECAQCQELAEREGSQMAPVLYLVNRVAEAVEQEFPDKAIETLAYQWTRKPPRTMRPRPNVIIRLCSIECCFMHPLATCDSEENRAFKADLEGWAKVANRLWVWDYVTSFRNYLVPFPNLRVRDDNIRLLIANNVRGIFEQDVYNTVGGELSELSGYLGAKLLWDRNYNEDRAINEFLEGVYGDAASSIRAYIDLLHDKVADENLHSGIWIDVDSAPFLTDDVVAEAERLWDEAEAAVAGDQEVLDRVQRARLPLEYVILEQVRGLGGIGHCAIDHERFEAVPDPAFVERVSGFFEVARRAGVSLLAERAESNIDAYEESFGSALSTDTLRFEPVDAVGKPSGAAGVRYRVYEGKWDVLPDFAELDPADEGVAESFGLNVTELEENFGLRFDGYVSVPRDGLYTFCILSNDGSRLSIGSDLVIDNDGLHGPRKQAGLVALRAGWHPIAVEYFQEGGSTALTVSYIGPGFEERVIGVDALRCGE